MFIRNITTNKFPRFIRHMANTDTADKLGLHPRQGNGHSSIDLISVSTKDLDNCWQYGIGRRTRRVLRLLTEIRWDTDALQLIFDYVKHGQPTLLRHKLFMSRENYNTKCSTGICYRVCSLHIRLPLEYSKKNLTGVIYGWHNVDGGAYAERSVHCGLVTTSYGHAHKSGPTLVLVLAYCQLLTAPSHRLN